MLQFHLVWITVATKVVGHMLWSDLNFYSSRFRIPNGAPNQTELVNFLGADFDPTLTSIGRPSTVAPRGCEIVPAAFGSGGKEL